MGLLYKCTGGGAGGYTHTHKSLDKPDKSEDKYGDFNHREDCTFSFLSSRKERKGESHCKVSQQKMPPVLGGHMEAVHFALRSWERLRTTDVIKKKKKKKAPNTRENNSERWRL